MTRDEYDYCRNCGGHKCMSCVLRDVHKRCIDDCPECCNPELFDVDEFRPVPSSTAHLF